SAPASVHVGNVVEAGQPLATASQRLLADVDEDQPARARGEHLRPASRARADFEHGSPGRDQRQQHIVDQRLLPLRRRGPLLAAGAPVVAIPPFAIGSRRVAAPRAVGASEPAVPLLGNESAVLDRPPRPAHRVPKPAEDAPRRRPLVATTHRRHASSCRTARLLNRPGRLPRGRRVRAPRPATLTEVLAIARSWRWRSSGPRVHRTGYRVLDQPIWA